MKIRNKIQELKDKIKQIEGTIDSCDIGDIQMDIQELEKDLEMG